MLTASEMHNLTGRYLKAVNAVRDGNMAGTELQTQNVYAPLMCVGVKEDYEARIKGYQADIDGMSEEMTRLRAELEEARNKNDRLRCLLDDNLVSHTM